MTLFNARSTVDVPAGGASPSRSPYTALAGSACWSRRRVGRWRWSVDGTWVGSLLENGCPDWLQLADHPRADLVKSNDGREVWRVQLNCGLVFAKVYYPSRRWIWLRRLLIGSGAGREIKVARYGFQHHIRTVQPIAAAEAAVKGRRPVGILITQGLAHAQPLNEVWASLDPAASATRRMKNLLIDRVAQLIAHAHQNGFEHTDLHAGNVLLDPTGDGDYRALFVDLHNIRIGRPVSDAAVTRNLAQFNQWFRLRTPLTDRLRFLDRYLYWRDASVAASAFGRQLAGDKRSLLGLLERAARRHARALYSKRDRRAARTGRYFTRLKIAGGWRGHAFLKSKYPVAGSPCSAMEFTAAQWQQWLRDPLHWLTPGAGRYAIKVSASGMVCRTSLPVQQGKPIEVVAKRSMPRSVGKWIKNLFRPSRALRTWQLANALLNRQIPTARPLAILQRQRLGLVIDSVILTEHIENAHDLDTLLTVQTRELSPHAQWQLKSQVTDSLAKVFRMFHARGFIHRDFKAPNIMVQWDPAGTDPPRVLLVDLDGVQQVRTVRWSAIVKALMRLNVSLDHCHRVSRTDRLRFLKRCLTRPGAPDPDWRPIWQAVAALSQRKRRRKSRQVEKMLAKYGRI